MNPKLLWTAVVLLAGAAAACFAYESKSKEALADANRRSRATDEALRRRWAEQGQGLAELDARIEAARSSTR